MSYTIINDNNITHLKTLEDNSIDSIVTDPPYGIEFLGKDWDTNTGAVETWRECLRVLKPGGYLLAFSAARTYHHLATNIQQVGFEIRDQLMWLYASGFPKAQQIKGHTGWKTALKPAHEPIVMARKPFKGSTYNNMDEWGVGALNIDASRIESEPFEYCADGIKRTTYSQSEPAKWNDSDKQMVVNNKGRFPSNVMGEVEGYQKYFYCPKVSRRERHVGFEQQGPTQAEMLELMGGHYIDAPINQNVWLPRIGNIKIHGLKHEYEKWSKNKDPLAHIEKLSNYSQGDVKNHPLWDPSIGTNLQRLKHKILEHNRDLGNNKDPLYNADGTKNRGIKGDYYSNNIADYGHNKPKTNVGNNHPTVKPVELMKYLINLVTPANGQVLDPFCGSGSTGMAAVELGHTFTGIELDANYCEIAKRRIAGWNKPRETNNTYNELFEENK